MVLESVLSISRVCFLVGVVGMTGIHYVQERLVCELVAPFSGGSIKSWIGGSLLLPGGHLYWVTFERPIKKKEISVKLKEKCAQLTKVTTKDITKNLEILCHALTETQEVLLLCYTTRTLFLRGMMIGWIWSTKSMKIPAQMSFIEMIDPLVQNIYACHAQDALEYLSSTYDMLPGLMAYDNHDYGRWGPEYWAMLSSMPEEHSL